MEVKIEGDENTASNIVNDEQVEQNPLRPIGESPSFRELCKLLDAISYDSKIKEAARRLRRRECLKQFFDVWRKVYGNDLYPCVRLLLPEKDRARSASHLKEDGLTRLYMNALGLEIKTSTAAMELLSWKRISKAQDDHKRNSHSTMGDFAQSLFTVIKDRISVDQTRLSIDDINEQLDSLASADSHNKLEIVRFWLDQVSPRDHLWLLRIILKDLKLGLSERNVLPFVHPHANELFNVCTDLREVCHTLHSPQVPLEDAPSSLKVFNVFKPMLSKRSRKNLPDVARLMLSGKNSEFVIEEKMDGERMQFHKSGDKYRFWSRHGKEYTDTYGASPMSGCLTPLIHHAFKPAVEEVILDGEILAWDPVTQKILPFGSVKSLKSSYTNARDQPKALFKVFDILYLKGKGKSNGTSLMDKPLSERRKVIESGRVFEQVKSRLELCYSIRGKTVEDIKKSFEKILDERGEGLIIKKLDSKYILNSRTDDWIKVKPDYMDELSEMLDVLAVGAFWGSGKRGGRFASLLVALVDDERSEPLQGLYRYKTLCRVAAGLSVDEMEQIAAKLQGKCQDWDKECPDRNPDWLDIGAEPSNSPDVWWHWKDSFLLTVKGAEIIPSSCYGCRLSIRFPRSIRFDIERDIADCMSYEELLAITVRLPESKRIGDDLSGHIRKRQRISASAQPSSSLREVKRSDSNKIFYGAEFWILQGLQETSESKNDLEVIVNANGGKIIHTVPRTTPHRDQFCISLRADFWDAEKVLRQGLSLIHPQWVLDSIKAGRRVSLTDPKYIIQVTQAEEPGLSQYHGDLNPGKNIADSVNGDLKDETDGSDPFQNSREASVTSDEKSFHDHPEKLLSDPETPMDFCSVSSDQLNAQKETSNNQTMNTETIEEGKQGMFYPLLFYLDQHPLFKSSQSLTTSHPEIDVIDEESKALLSDVKVLIECNGGKIVSNLEDPNLTHIICTQRNTSRCLDLIRTNNDRSKRRRLVLTDWVFDSVKSSTCLYEADYLPVF